MRKRFANRRGNNYKQIRVDDSYFKGYACYVNFDNIKEPKVVFNGLYNIKIIDNGYEWIMLYPDNEFYSITIIYDNKNNLVEWYFDVASNVGIVNGIPYQDDLYLDMVILPTKEILVLDEDELIDAHKNNLISDEDKMWAYKTLEYLKQHYGNNIEELVSFTHRIYTALKDI